MSRRYRFLSARIAVALLLAALLGEISWATEGVAGAMGL